MGSDVVEEGSASADSINSGEMASESNNIVSLKVDSSSGDISQELASAAESLTRVELDLACSSEKLVNLDLLVIHVASMENDFEAFALEEDSILEGSVEKAFQFDILYGYLDSEVIELNTFLLGLQVDVDTSSKALSYYKQFGDFKEMEEKFQDCEESLKQSFEQLTDIKIQSANFRNILLNSSRDEKWKYEKDFIGTENGEASSMNTKIKMHTLEQQRNILKMLEKSLARETDLVKKLHETRLIEENSKFRLQQEVLCIKEEAEIVWERLVEAENSAEVLLGVSKEMFQQIQMAQFELNRYIQREGQLRFQFENLNNQLKEKECALQDFEHSRDGLVEKVNSLEQKLSDFLSAEHSAEDIVAQNRESSLKMYEKENINDDSKGKVTEVEKNAESSEAELELLRESNVNLSNELISLKSSNSDTTKRVEQLELQLRESELRRLHAEASAEASEEKNSTLNRTVEDMEHLIRDLKSKVSKAEIQVESIEDRCIALSESNAELVGEINFVRARSECLETSLHRADDAKKDTAKDVRMYSKFIADLVVQLTLERKRLQKQISSSSTRKQSAAKHSQLLNERIPLSTNERLDAKTKLNSFSNAEIKQRKSGGDNDKKSVSFSTDHEVGDSPVDLLTKEKKSVASVSTSNVEIVRNIDAKQMNIKYAFVTVLVSIILVYVAFLFQH